MKPMTKWVVGLVFLFVAIYFAYGFLIAFGPRM
jgi:hypothetical protein